MRSISLWSRQHLWPARILIVLLHLALAALGLFSGDLLYLSGINLSVFIVYGACILFLISALAYPSKKSKANYSNFYRFQKSIDLALVITSFVIITALGNGYHASPRAYQYSYAVSYAAVNKVVPSLSTGTVKPMSPGFTKKGVKSLKQKFKQRIRAIRKQYKNASGVGKAFLIALAALVAFGLWYLLAVLSCNLTCSGSMGAGLLVAVSGTGLIVLLLIIAIRAITREKPVPKRTEPAEETIPDSVPSV